MESLQEAKDEAKDYNMSLVGRPGDGNFFLRQQNACKKSLVGRPSDGDFLFNEANSCNYLLCLLKKPDSLLMDIKLLNGCRIVAESEMQWSLQGIAGTVVEKCF